VGEVLRFFFLEEGLGEASGEGLGLGDFFFFGEGEMLAVGFSVGLGLGDAFFLGEGDFSGDAVGFGEGEGDLVAVVFFFVFRGAGVGVGAKIFLSLLPNDSSAGAFTAAPAANAMTSKVQRIRMERERSTDGGEVSGAKPLSSRAAPDGEGPPSRRENYTSPAVAIHAGEA
jgi:hypothetical protein